VFGHDQTFLEWAAERDPEGSVPYGRYWVIGLVDDDGRAIGAVTIVQTSAAGVQIGLECENAVTRQAIRDTFAFIFGHLGASRCELVTRRTNKVMKKHAPNLLGFRFEGVRRDYYGPGDDGLAFVMQPQTCKWIDHGLSIAA